MAPLLRHLTAALARRQDTGTDAPPPDTSDQSADSSELSGGAIAGIVIGSIVGVLLLWWIFRSCGNGFGMGPGDQRAAAAPPPRDYYYHHEKGRRGRSRSSRGHRHHHHHHASPRRSGSLRPVVIETGPRAPQATYQYQTPRGYDDGYGYPAQYTRTRSRSRRPSAGY
ncbi:hypothetical protein S40288_09292 [Stachybotrys chartarum IBT 40288]|nr:hypothetical protein S40288_09292 [Stachybotrys chartarum IBT 40288]